jgi:hypothetical protein
MNAKRCLKPKWPLAAANIPQTKAGPIKRQQKVAVIKYCIAILAAVAIMAVVIKVFDLGFNVTFVVGVALAVMALNLLIKKPWRKNPDA